MMLTRSSREIAPHGLAFNKLVNDLGAAFARQAVDHLPLPLAYASIARIAAEVKHFGQSVLLTVTVVSSIMRR